MKKYRHIVLLAFVFLLGFNPSAFSEDYYWVGGKGSWSSLNHWETANGQIPNEVPDPTDNVIFNENSFITPFDTVFILTGNPTCNNFTVTGIQDSVVFYGGSSTSTFSVYGSWSMHEKAKIAYSGKIKFMSNNLGNTITTAGTWFQGEVWFEGGGEWILQDTLAVIDTLGTGLKIELPPLQGYSWGESNIYHTNGRLNANEQVIICGVFSTHGNELRELVLVNCDFYALAGWNLSAENLAFHAANSMIYIAGTMNNFNGSGGDIYFNDVDLAKPEGRISNTDIRTHMRKVHYLGGGLLEGNTQEGQYGMFTIDTLIMEGGFTPTGPVPNMIQADYSDIHYTLFRRVSGSYEGNHGVFHRLDDSCSGYGRFTGANNAIDSIHFCKAFKAIISGSNVINHLAYFHHEGILNSYPAYENQANHVVMNGNGWFLGSNTISKLSISPGYWYRMSADKLDHPGSIPTQSYVQTIGEIEITGSCVGGFAFLSSDHKETMAYLNYLGENFQAEYFAVKDVHNTGQEIQLQHSIDLGNTLGFDFENSPEPRTLYWVGGGGNWSDKDHWSLDEGGEGGECPPTPLDDIYFNMASGFSDSGMVVNVDIKYACCRDFTWNEVENLPAIATDTNNLRVWGSFLTNPGMLYAVWGNVYFESEDDEDYESVVIEWGGNQHRFNNQVHFWGRGGKWRLDSKFENYNDTTFLTMGELLLENDTLSVFQFTATDTLRKGMYMLGKTLITLHAYGQNGWHFNAYNYIKDNPETSSTLWDAGRSTIRSIGNIAPPSPSSPPGYCDVNTFGGHLDYHNIEFGDTTDLYDNWYSPGSVHAGEGSQLISTAECTYNLVDYYTSSGKTLGWATIDTLTWHRKTMGNGQLLSADNNIIRNEHMINFLFAESAFDTLIMAGGRIDTAFFYQEGGLFGYHNIGYLEGHKDMSLELINNVDTAVFMGNTTFRDKNTFSRLVLWPDRKYSFQHETGLQGDTTTIKDDWIVNGDCDAPIRLQSDSIGTGAKVNYLAANPTNTDYTANFTSIRDIWMVGNETHYATNSVDLGNNINWEFVSSGSQVYYWVGGQGNWSDWTHWSFESGGDPIQDHCVPKEINTVVFDDNSFNSASDSVFVDVDNAYCLNMYWKHTPGMYTPSFIGQDSAILYVYGSLLLNESMDYNFRGRIFFDELNMLNVVDTLTTKGHALLNDIRFQGINDVVVLGDNLKLASDPGAFNVIFLEHGEFRTDGYKLEAEGFRSRYKNPRTLNIENSNLVFSEYLKRIWWVDGDNLELHAENSCIYNEALFSSIYTENGGYLKYHDVMLSGPLDSLYNHNNVCEYNVVGIRAQSGTVAGNFIADSILFRGNNSAIFGTSTTNVVILDSIFGSINNNHSISTCIVNKYGIIRGTNDFDYCIFHDDGVFMGTNEFDTLVLFPGWGNASGQGNWFYFEANKTQTIYDSLYLRGNPCSNITIASLGAPDLAWIKKDEGDFDVSCDYLNIMSVGAESASLIFYAGINSTALPDPENPPPGWVFENAQGYIYGFNGLTQRFCEGESYRINSACFNGDPNTRYYWEENPVPGSAEYEVSEAGTYTLRVEYSEGCYVDDYVVVEIDQAPAAVIEGGPYCEGDMITLVVEPAEGTFTYEWWNGDTTEYTPADPAFTEGIYVAVTDASNNCKTWLKDSLEIKPAPKPQNYLDGETWIKFQESITLDAGPGDSWAWSSDPQVPIENSSEQYITVTGFGDPNPVTYTVVVEVDGCVGEGSRIIGMYPPSKLGVPTAFSPNGDGDNDVLKVLGTGFAEMDFRIYNRYGQLVFVSNDPAQGWDGNVKGKKQEMEVYTYYLRVKFEDMTEEEEKGNITLLR